ncbi:MAG: ATP-binding cassette domain-containing protein [Bacteroidales bacterium]|nr:ATP-binding cassette domain-containing protein [Bacteroidales bacterium]
MDTAPLISLSNVFISHQDGPILSHVNLQIPKGDFVYMIGKSGAGKTSLLRALYADVPITEGSASVCGFDLTHLRRRDLPRLRRSIGIVFQSFRLLPDRNVRDNLLFVLRATGWKKRKEMDARIEEVLQWVGVADKAGSMPFRLSEGEQQRVGIARAIINNPALILADEPTGNLDPITSQEIISLLRDINKKQEVTMLISTHDFMTIEKYPARVVCCENGTLVDPEANQREAEAQ